MKVFSVGLFRTGTTTMCEMFAKSFRADHEFRVEDEIDAVMKRIAGTASDTELRAFVRERASEKPLDLDSCGAHFGLVDILATEFPEAKFILTLRNVYSWLNSCVGKLYGDFVGGWGSRAGMLANSLECLPDYTFGIEDRSGYRICLEQMMKTWAGINRYIMHVAPADRLLVVSTETLSLCTDKIAAFCDIDRNLLESCHSNPGQAANFLDCFDPDRLEELVEKHCSELMSERYPDFTLRSHSSREWPAASAACSDLHRYFVLDRFCPLEPAAAGAAI
jgi:Sulfotransferase domain